MSSFRNLALICGIACLCLPVSAGVDVDLGATVRVGDDTDLFFGISSRYFDRDRDEVRRWGERFRDPDDLAVALFLYQRTGRSLDALFTLRRGGSSWWEIGMRYGVPADAWFVPVDRHPGPPFGKAYGYWKRHRHDRRAAIRLTDLDARNLVAVRMAHEYYGVPVDVAMQWRSSGKSVQVLMTDEYNKRHGKGHGATSHGASKKHGKPKPKSKGRGKHK